jgi:hypothetical protein
MAKANVNTASRDELVEAGVRAELADEILKLRRKGKISLEALDQVPGVGPATLEQLRKSLDFSDQGGSGGEQTRPSERAAKEAPERTVELALRRERNAADAPERVVEAAREGEHRLEEAAERTTEVARAAVRGGTEVARTAMSAGAQATSSVTRGGLQMVERATSTVSEAQRRAAQRSTESAAELVQVFMDLAREQSRQNLEMLTTLTQAVRWDQLLDAHSAFLRASLERMAEFNRRYLEITQTVMASATARDQRDRVA